MGTALTWMVLRDKLVRLEILLLGSRFILRKEVIQPQVLLRLPCYDFTPITATTLVGFPLAVGSPASGYDHFRGVTGGVYKARERIHRSVLICDY